MGELPETIDAGSVSERVAQIRETRNIALGSCGQVSGNSFKFEELNTHRGNAPKLHANGRRFTVFSVARNEFYSKVYYSVGGKLVVNEAAMGADRIVEDSTERPYLKPS